MTFGKQSNGRRIVVVTTVLESVHVQMNDKLKYDERQMLTQIFKTSLISADFHKVFANQQKDERTVVKLTSAPAKYTRVMFCFVNIICQSAFRIYCKYTEALQHVQENDCNTRGNMPPLFNTLRPSSHPGNRRPSICRIFAPNFHSIDPAHAVYHISVY